MAVGIHDAVKGGDDVIDFRGVLLLRSGPALVLLMGFLLFFLVFAEDLVERAESSFLLLGLTVLGRKRPSRLCSRETGKNKNAMRGQEMGERTRS